MLRLFKENTKIALGAIRSQLLRTVLTVFIIASGIWALVGILSAVNALESSLMSNFAAMGSNTFNISRYDFSSQLNRNSSETRTNPIIDYSQARSFKENYNAPFATTSLSFTASSTTEVKYENKKTDPEVSVIGADELYFENSGLKVDQGNTFSEIDILSNLPVCVVGADFTKNLLKDVNPLGKVISIRGAKFKVIGVLEEKGSMFGNKQDLRVFIPIQQARSLFSQGNINYEIKVLVQKTEFLNTDIDEAILTMRSIRGLHPTQIDNFGISRSDDLINQLKQQTQMLTVIAVLIGVITIFGSSIALMNIMLVSVTERTKEIGIRKSLGAKSSTIAWQFFTETLVIGQLGGILGTILGLITGYIFTRFVGFDFVIPWGAIIGAIIISLIVALISGLFPAIKASKLDPVEALRYE